MPDFTHEDAVIYAHQFPHRTLKHVADTLKGAKAQAAAVYVRGANSELKSRIGRLQEGLRRIGQKTESAEVNRMVQTILDDSVDPYNSQPESD